MRDRVLRVLPARPLRAALPVDRLGRGGVEIEEVARTSPDKVAKVGIDPVQGLTDELARQIARDGAFPEEHHDQLVGILHRLWDTFVSEDRDARRGQPAGGDAGRPPRRPRRQGHAGRQRRRGASPGARRPRRRGAADALEAKAKAKGLNYVKLDGSVGIIGNGRRSGHEHARRGRLRRRAARRPGARQLPRHRRGANAQVMADGLDVILNDPDVKSVFVNVFAASPPATRSRTASRRPSRSWAAPCATRSSSRLDGNNADEGRRILDEAGIEGLERLDTMTAPPRGPPSWPRSLRGPTWPSG